MKVEIIERIPTWVACYYLYNDGSGLEDRDIELADKFYDKCMKDGYRLIQPVDECEPYFTYYPAFGGGTDVQDWYVEVMEDSDDSSDAVQN